MITVEPSSRWSAPAAAYDAWFDRPWGRHATAIEHRMLLAAAGPIEGREVLDAGCGTGRFMHRLEAEGAHVIGVDRNPDALAIARTGTTGALVLGDTHQIPLPDRVVDVAFAVTVCEFAANPARVFAELVRVTKPAGRVVIGSLNRSSPWGWWNRRQFSKAPWDGARFLDRDTLVALGAAHGRCELRAGLYAPDVLPVGNRCWPALERFGRRIAPRLGAFQVLTIQLPGSTGPDRVFRTAPHMGIIDLGATGRRVLAVCAHPDDESFGLGAVISTLVAQGASIDLVCLTQGEASTLGDDAADLAQARCSELTAAAAGLGINAVHQFDYPDGQLSTVDIGLLAETIRPFAGGSDVLLVFDEGGITGHRDHVATTAAAMAVAEVLDLPVLAWTLDRHVADTLNAAFSARFVGRADDEIDVRLPVERSRQRAAMRCHDSQLVGNPIPERRIALTGDTEPLRFLRRSHRERPTDSG